MEVSEKRFINDKKRDYLIRNLSRTRRKDYENFIITAIYHKLGRQDIKPVTQQYIKRSDGKYALLDLYFPQINYAVECDEAHHINNSYNDVVRKVSIEDVLSSVEETQDFIFKRIRAYEDLESIEAQINQVISEIRQLLSEREIEKWDVNFDPVKYSIINKCISVNDRLQFDTIANLSKCFGKSYKTMQRSFFNVDNGYYVWCPKLAVKVEGELQSKAKGWINVLSDNWDQIYERNEEPRQLQYATRFQDMKRIIFAKSKDIFGVDTYRFIGVFSYAAELSTKYENVYLREDTCINLELWMNDM